MEEFEYSLENEQQFWDGNYAPTAPSLQELY